MSRPEDPLWGTNMKLLGTRTGRLLQPLKPPEIGQPCELHELTGCSICSGLDKQLRAEDDAEDAPVKIAPGVVLPGWPGKCDGCGTDFPKGEAIRYSNACGGWTPVSGVCC